MIDMQSIWITRDEKSDELTLFTEEPTTTKVGMGNNKWTIWVRATKTCRRYHLASSMYPEITFENSPKEMVVKEYDESYEELKDKYEALHMTYLSQVSMWKSLYEQELKKNKELND